MVSSNVSKLEIVVDLESKELNCVKRVLNLYGPYVECPSFWEAFLSSPYFILGGNLNFTKDIREVWGSSLYKAPLGDFFIHFMFSHHLVDVDPIKLVPIWRNYCKD